MVVALGLLGTLWATLMSIAWQIGFGFFQLFPWL
jgi:hypothetical protein